jgi:hypothetical protein
MAPEAVLVVIAPASHQNIGVWGTLCRSADFICLCLNDFRESANRHGVPKALRDGVRSLAP